jgi:DNA-binding response OmpR family regulator
MRLLLVDDERNFVETLTKRLRLRGIDSDCAFDAEEALRMARRTRYDVILLDVKMPGLGGIELRRRLEELDPSLRFLFITGHASQSDLAVGSSEASHYLTKPLHLDELLEAVEDVTGEDMKGGKR